MYRLFSGKPLHAPALAFNIAPHACCCSIATMKRGDDDIPTRCVRACVCACVRACVRVCVRACVCAYARLSNGIPTSFFVKRKCFCRYSSPVHESKLHVARAALDEHLMLMMMLDA